MITAIITNYNQGRFINSAFGSLLSQSLKPDEIIIVDDKSTDNSVELIKECIGKYNGPIQVKLIERETNGKPAGARNSGINVATGDILCFLDIDDYYYQDKIKESVAILNRYPEVGLVYTDYNTNDPYTKQNKREFKFSYNYNILWQTCVVSTNSILRKSAIDKVGRFNEDPDYKGVEDYDMWLRISQQFMIYHVPKPLFFYNQHGDNLTIKEGPLMAKRVENMKRRLINGN